MSYYKIPVYRPSNDKIYYSSSLSPVPRNLRNPGFILDVYETSIRKHRPDRSKYKPYKPGEASRKQSKQAIKEHEREQEQKRYIEQMETASAQAKIDAIINGSKERQKAREERAELEAKWEKEHRIEEALERKRKAQLEREQAEVNKRVRQALYAYYENSLQYEDESLIPVHERMIVYAFKYSVPLQMMKNLEKELEKDLDY